MRKLSAILLVLACIISCTSNTIYKEPDDLINKGLMIDLILDIEIANASRNLVNTKGVRVAEYMPLVYEKFGIDSARFTRSNFYYSTKIDDYSKMLQEVQKKLETMQKELETVKNIQDSIKFDKKIQKRKSKKAAEALKDSILK